jgi:hypothetical protein
MKSYLKESSFKLPDGESITIRELSAGGRRALMEASEKSKGDHILFAAVAAKAGCPDYANESPEAIMDNLPIELLQELAGAVLSLSGISATDEAAAEKN